ncbi:acid sphingomyelinase-like phosphodiesterase 3b [Lingula anatina]|uniref:Acid sphingomyelinase-like phosphodiesterase 3b n=1 Tax=Lingula anatina TaxID=7574 RepID=A0A1S3J4F0_LINAN|nr:acid sphingomyelinase-like phosphodiesterase 3b [Lingula anatina]|eukprot:XP_013405141.1 acid sphingomyelinase-like phosphodiesterase 3b [Lingula anatina]
MASCMYTVFMLVGLVSVPQVIGGIGFFWHVADLHYDPNVFPDTQQKPYGDYVNDSPWSLVNSSLHAMKQIEPNADFILWTGDTGPHRKNSVENTISIIHDVTNLFIEVFPNTVVYAAFGNHDYSPPDQFPPHENNIYYAAANMWQRWYRDSTAKKTLLKGYCIYMLRRAIESLTQKIFLL